MSAQIFASDISRLYAWRAAMQNFVGLLGDRVADIGGCVVVVRERQIAQQDLRTRIRDERQARRDEAQAALDRCEAMAASGDDEDHDWCSSERMELMQRERELAEAQQILNHIVMLGHRLSGVETSVSQANARASRVTGIDIPAAGSKITRAAIALRDVHAIPGGSFDSLGIRAARAAGLATAFRAGAGLAAAASAAVGALASAIAKPAVAPPPPSGAHPLAGLLGRGDARAPAQSSSPPTAQPASGSSSNSSGGAWSGWKNRDGNTTP